MSIPIDLLQTSITSFFVAAAKTDEVVQEGFKYVECNQRIYIVDNWLFEESFSTR